ncbi:class I SAM-dependent methyltransferase [Cohnella caldifontis]|uniref:class I SAM-dependent methyltransferase n=1 Tax=Cohnella caldifontis TaxID=3027471 RepID=UPI0023ED216F|nr:class I SAM-dependent methyltransferase [Cohnella sp. YIM B05605]
MNSKERFSNRVEDYVKYRPGYPREAIDYLYEEGGLSAESVAADIGAGTGIFSRYLLERGTKVIGVEPNDRMRGAAEEALSGFPGFRAVPGSAEATGLPGAYVDFIVSAQAFHWFDQAAARREFARILKPGGKTALIWNVRLTSGTRFLEEYEDLLLKLGTDYADVNLRNVTREQLASFFRRGTMREARFTNRQIVDFDGLSGRLRSSSYAPAPGHPNHEPMMRELKALFDRNQQNGHVSLDYETTVYLGEMES